MKSLKSKSSFYVFILNDTLFKKKVKAMPSKKKSKDKAFTHSIFHLTDSKIDTKRFRRKAFI